MSKNTTNTPKINDQYYLVSLVVYVAAIVIASVLLLNEPNGFDAKAVILPLIVVLLASSVGIGYKIASRGSTKLLSMLGTLALAILFTFVGFFVVAAVAWLIGVVHAA